MDPLRAPARPGSSHSYRSVSRASQRPLSRLSQRTIVKQPRVVALLDTLVKQVTAAEAGYATEDIQEAVDLALKRLDQTKQAAVPDLNLIDAQFRGLSQKAQINIQETFAQALLTKYKELKVAIFQRKDLDSDITPSTLPNYLHLLLLLSSPPSTSTLSQADTIFSGGHDCPPQFPVLTWEQILKEEPFDGQHWQGAYGLPKGSTVEQPEEESIDSDDISLLGDVDYEENTWSNEGELHLAHAEAVVVQDQYRLASKNRQGKETIEALQAKQYWRSGWRTDSTNHHKFDINEPSTLGPSLDRLLIYGGVSILTKPKIYVNEVDAVREVLMALQGCHSCLFEFRSDQDGHIVKAFTDRRIVHFTDTSQTSILSSFASSASTLNQLRQLVKQTDSRLLTVGQRCRTFEAFSAAVEHQLHTFDKWCATKQESINLAQRGRYIFNHVVSLLGLEQEVRLNMTECFNVLLNVTRTITSAKGRSTPSTTYTLILDTLLDAVRTRLAINDSRTAGALMEVWAESVEPLWSNLERWLKDGISISAGFEGESHNIVPTWHDEFFIRINPLVDIGSREFWEGCYTLPSRRRTHTAGSLSSEAQESVGIPYFLTHVAEDILAAGKAVGLLRAIDAAHLDDDWLKGWIKFKHLTGSLSLEDLGSSLSNLISDTLLPPCRLMQSTLRQVLVEECGMWKHVQGLESVCLMTRGDAMSQFSEKLFSRMDTRRPWNDFHFLNTAFRDVTKLGSHSWINASLVRFTYRGNKDRSITRTVRAIDGLAVEYAIPFPLTYLFGFEANAGYSSLFCFLLQIRRSKVVLDRILIRGLHSAVLNYSLPDLKPFHVLRSKLSWFVNRLLNFIMTDVIHASLLRFHDLLQNAGSLDDMISIHRSHLERLLGRSLLQSDTLALHQAILSILDLSLQFNDCLSAFAGDASFDVSRHSLVLMRHRHQRWRRGERMSKADVIGFTDTLPSSEDDSISESDDGPVVEPSVVSMGVAPVNLAENFFIRLDRMNQELDGLVRFIRRGVESLAAGTGGASQTFGVLAFCLEDWDL